MSVLFLSADEPKLKTRRGSCTLWGLETISANDCSLWRASSESEQLKVL